MRTVFYVSKAVFLFFLILEWAQATPLIKNPIDDFIHFKGDEREIYVPNRKEILKLEIDVFGNGRKIIFLSFPGFTSGREGNIWTAYAPKDEGCLRYSRTKDDDLIVFRTDAYLVATVKSLKTRALAAYFPGKDGGDIYAYVFEKDGVAAIKIKSVSLQPGDDLETVFKEFRNGKHSENMEKLEEIPIEGKVSRP